MSTAKGNRAEEIAAKYLESKGYEILDRNWRRPKCEIDIVASKKTKKNLFSKEKIIYFVEVKYRKQNEQGGGLEYITPAKLKQMQLAARMWASENDWEGSYELSAVEVSGEEFEITEFLRNIVV